MIKLTTGRACLFEEKIKTVHNLYIKLKIYFPSQSRHQTPDARFLDN